MASDDVIHIYSHSIQNGGQWRRRKGEGERCRTIVFYNTLVEGN